jgi:hypothetical protein
MFLLKLVWMVRACVCACVCACACVCRTMISMQESVVMRVTHYASTSPEPLDGNNVSDRDVDEMPIPIVTGMRLWDETTFQTCYALWCMLFV